MPELPSMYVSELRIWEVVTACAECADEDSEGKEMKKCVSFTGLSGNWMRMAGM